MDSGLRRRRSTATPMSITRTSGSRADGTRTEASSPARSDPSRRTANDTTRKVGTSSHCRSSIAMTTGDPFDIRDEQRMEAGRGGKAADRLAGLRFDARRAISSARRCGPGASPSRSRCSPSRSSRPAKGSSVSDWTGCDVRTVYPRASARARISDQTVVLPIPGSPSSTSVAEPPSSASRNRSPAARSSSRPITPGRRIPDRRHVILGRPWVRSDRSDRSGGR